jgi:hypothetical protein
LKYLEERLFTIKVPRQYRTTPKGKIITKNAWKGHFGSQDPIGFPCPRGTVSYDLTLELSDDVNAAVITIKRARIAPLSPKSMIAATSFTTLGWISLDAPKNQKGEGYYMSKISGIEEALVNELLGALGVTYLTKENLTASELTEGEYALS